MNVYELAVKVAEAGMTFKLEGRGPSVSLTLRWNPNGTDVLGACKHLSLRRGPEIFEMLVETEVDRFLRRVENEKSYVEWKKRRARSE